MQINFIKYHGTANDFILIDNREKFFDLDTNEIEELCNRRFGIGADGLMLLENSNSCDFKMRYFNSDGKEGSMCGNGGRCIVAFAKKLGIIKNEANFIAMDGLHKAEISKNNTVKLKMQDINHIEINDQFTYLNTGSPHAVFFIESHNNFDTYTEGRKIRYNSRFKKIGTNVNFVSIIDNNTINVSTYERGVEDETYSCGTGCVASAIASSLKINPNTNYFNIKTKGGNLKVSFKKINNIFEDIILEGPTKEIFSGSIQ